MGAEAIRGELDRWKACLEEATGYLRGRIGSFEPRLGIVLGTGLGQLAEHIAVEWEFPYPEIPHFPVSTVESHAGRLLFGHLEGCPVMVMQGRFHYYEGYSMKEITFPIRVMYRLGVRWLFISNAAGGLNPAMQVSDLMIIRDHINLLPENPLRGANWDELGPRFPDMSMPYDVELIRRAREIAEEMGIRVHEGVYVAVAGPNLETKAEYQFLRLIGADAVGMSTVPEVIVARHMGMKVFGVSVITDIGYPVEKVEEVTLERVIEAARRAEPWLTELIRRLVQKQFACGEGES